MALQIPTTQQIVDDILAFLESFLNQETPLNDKAFNRVLSAVIGFAFTTLYKYASERVKQDLAITATGDNLVRIGNNYGVAKKPAESTVLEATLPGTNGTLIPNTVDFVGDPNGIRYSNDISETITGGFATLSLTSDTTGTIGNLLVGDTLTIGTQVAGAETVATVTDILNTGAEAETDEAYRVRILDVIRAVGGGGNATDYRLWAQEVAGVARAYPYAGRPVGDSAATAPPDRTVYVQADTTIDPDGIAPQSLLDEVRDTITTDPATALARQPLGLTDETLFVVSISRTAFYVRINGLTISADIEAQVKSDIETALTNYFLAITPFVDGIDSVIDRNDKITDLTVSQVVQDVLSANGGSATGINFGLSPGASLIEYQLSPGELAKLTAGGVSYA